MNKACERCGRIIVVPDIPLPADYTQKCPACGYDNPVSDDYTPQPSGPSKQAAGYAQPGNPSGGIGNHFDNAIDNIFSGAGGTPRQAPAANRPQPQRQAAPVTQTPKPAPPKQAVAKPAQTAGVPAQVIDQLRREFQAELDRTKADLRNEMEGRLRMLEDRLKADASNFTPPGAGPANTEKKKEQAFQSQVHERLLENQVLVATQNATVIKSCEATLQRRGFQLNPVTSLEGTLEQIAKKPYHLVIIDQRMLKYASDSQALLGKIKQISLPIRRCQTIAMITPGITTAESQVFYQWGIDINIHTKDLERLDEILTDILELKEEILNEYIADMYAYT